jgi:putative acetyltransferase
LLKDPETIFIRPFNEGDAVATAKIFFDAVRLGSVGHYDEAQRRAWAPEIPDNSNWLERLMSQTVLVAEQDSEAVAFMTLRTDGHIDLAFVSPGQIGQGIAHKLYLALEARAISTQMKRLTCDASLMARPFFERQGWRVVVEQSVSRDEVSLTNFVMEKILN